MNTKRARQTINVDLLDPKKRDYVDYRVSRLDWTSSQFVRKILEIWFEKDCPVVHELDAIVPFLSYAEWLKAERPTTNPPNLGEEATVQFLNEAKKRRQEDSSEAPKPPQAGPKSARR